MAIYHVHTQYISKSGGKSAIAAAAYRSASKLTERLNDSSTGEEIEFIWDYTRKRGIALSKILAPEDIPSWVYNRFN